MNVFERAVAEHLEHEADVYEVECARVRQATEAHFASVEETWKAEALKNFLDTLPGEGDTPLTEEEKHTIIEQAEASIAAQFEHDKQEHLAQALSMVRQPPSEEQVRMMYDFLKEPENPAEDTAPFVPNFHELVYKVSDLYWSVPEHKFIPEPDDKTNVVELADTAALRRTLNFYRNTSQPWIVIGDELLNPQELYARNKAAINATTSKAITSGFSYEINGEVLHFHYDSYDQINFADTANYCLMAKMELIESPSAIVWKAYKALGEQVTLRLTPDEFLELYKEALSYKSGMLNDAQEKRDALGG